MENFFLKRVEPESTAARVQKSSAEIKAAWGQLLARRRLVQKNDTVPIQDRDTLAKMYTAWMHEWLRTNLSLKQQGYKFNQKSSIFCAWLKNNYGGKAFVMALWQTGIQWAPTESMLKSYFDIALERHRSMRKPCSTLHSEESTTSISIPH